MITGKQHIDQLLASSAPKKRPSKKRYRKPTEIRELEKLDFEFRYKDSILPEKYKSKNMFRDDTANGMTKAIIAYIKIRDGQAFRINTQGQYDTKLKKWRHSGMRKGLPDIQAVVNGQFLGIEVKIGRDWQRPQQKKIQNEIEASGGYYYLAKNFSDFKIWFDQLLIN